jgi:N-acetyl sugar amidotransferase
MRCTRCVLRDDDDPAGFDDARICSFCRGYDATWATIEQRRGEGELDRIIALIKSAGANKQHDCIIGLSGGVDSSYLAHVAVSLGLRPLAIHLDNGWDSELAIGNISRLVNGLGLELETLVIDWREFRDLQIAYFRSSVIDIEVLTDHAITAFAFDMARREGVKYILSGNNVVTEYGIPPTWNYPKQDLRNLKAIARRFGGPKLETFPTASGVRLLREQLRGLRSIDLLNLVDYDRNNAIELLSREYGYRPYGAKHYESLFTRFYQAHVLPTKFGVDKREAHLSSLIRSGQMTRDEALAELQKPLYDEETLREHSTYVRKKLGFSDEEWARIMAEEPRPHTAYPNDRWYMVPLARGVLNLLNATYDFRKRLRRSPRPIAASSEGDAVGLARVVDQHGAARTVEDEERAGGNSGRAAAEPRP